MLVDAVIASVAVGKVRKGSIKGLGKMPVKKPYLFAAAFLIQFLIVYLGGKNLPFVDLYAPHLHFISFCILFTALWINRHIWEMKLIGTGVLCNFIAIFTNGGQMPVSTEALERSEMLYLVELLKSNSYPTHTLMKQHMNFKFLGDVFSLPPPYPRPRVFSIGDVIMAIGLFLLIQHYMVVKNQKQ